MRLKKRLAQFLAVALGFFLCPLFDAAIDALLRYPLYLLLTMLALGLTVRALEPLARKRGWGARAVSHATSIAPGLSRKTSDFTLAPGSACEAIVSA
jgi:hypothetical protein